MATNTYVALDKVTVGTATPSITFTGISGSYTDLVIVASNVVASSGFPNIGLRFNSDTGANYSSTILEGTGSTARSVRKTNVTTISDGDNVSLGGSTPSTIIYNIMNYSNTTTYKTVLLRANDTTSSTYAGVSAVVGLWRNTAAITSVTLTLGDFAAGATFSLYGIKSEAVPTAKATGGTISYSVDGYTYHTFTSSGTFTPTAALTADTLVIAGGGAGNSNYYSGGGGAGGLRGLTSQSFSSGVAYTCTIGAGGAGSTNNNNAKGNNGSNSTIAGSGFTTISATGGGGAGGNGSGNNSIYIGASGGSGGGAAAQGEDYNYAGGAGNAGSYSPVEGYAGGASDGRNGGYAGAGGGGGAGGVGTAGKDINNGAKAGNGGVGSSAYSTWGSVTGTGQNVSGTYYYAGGGGGGYLGGTETQGVGGYGGGANGNGVVNGTAGSGTANTGGGGGGTGYGDGSQTAGSGGSGIVIIRYASV